GHEFIPFAMEKSIAAGAESDGQSRSGVHLDDRAIERIEMPEVIDLQARGAEIRGTDIGHQRIGRVCPVLDRPAQRFDEHEAEAKVPSFGTLCTRRQWEKQRN